MMTAASHELAELQATKRLVRATYVLAAVTAVLIAVTLLLCQATFMEKRHEAPTQTEEVRQAR